jgi:hypothetical protein
MANKVLTYSATTSQRTFDTLEKWRDLDKIAIDNNNYQYVSEVYLSDYVKFLKTEHKINDNNLSHILAEK